MKAQQQRKANKNEVLKKNREQKIRQCEEAEGKKKKNKKPYDITE